MEPKYTQAIIIDNFQDGVRTVIGVTNEELKQIADGTLKLEDIMDDEDRQE